MGLLVEAEENFLDFEFFDVLSENITKLQNLKSLSLHNCKLKSLPEGLKELKQLELLNLSSNDFSQFPKVITKIESLKYLCIGANAINSVPDSIVELKNLKLLAINNVSKIIEWNDEVYFSERIERIDHLNLNDLYKFNNIEEIDLGGVMSEIIYRIDFSKFPLLKNLGLFGCQLNTLPYSILNLRGLKRIDLANNVFTKFPIEILKLKEMDTLLLWNNNIRRVPEIVKEHNFLEEKISVPYVMEFFWGLDLRFNPIENIPASTIDLGFSAIKSYLTEIENGKIVMGRLIILGKDKSETNYLINKLTNHNKQYINNESDNIWEINIKNWIFSMEGNNYEIVTCNFGNIQDYIIPQEAFFSKQSLYLIFWDVNQGETHLLDWLNKIRVINENCPVIIVMKKTNKYLLPIEINNIEKMFPNIYSFEEIDVENNLNVDELREKIQSMVKGANAITTDVHRKWDDIRTTLLTETELPEANIKGYITIDDYYTTCKSFGLNTKAANELTEVLKNLGLFFHDSVDADIIILNPSWLMKAIFHIVNEMNVIISNGSVFRKLDLFEVLFKYGYQSITYGTLLKILESYKMCYRWTDNEYIMMNALPLVPTENIVWGYTTNRLKLECNFDLIPRGFVIELIREINLPIEHSIQIWRAGIFCRKDNCEFLIISDPINKKNIIDIEIRGEGSQNLLHRINEALDRTSVKYNNINLIKKIACNCSYCAQSSNKPLLLELNLLKGISETDIKKKRLCLLSQQDFDIEQLLKNYDFNSSKSGRSTISETKQVSILTTKEVKKVEEVKDKNIKIFISYSSSDRELMEQLVKLIWGHLKSREGTNYSIWSDKAIDLGADWDKEIEKVMLEAQVAILLVSSNFVSSSYIENVELETFFKKSDDGKLKIIPVLLRDYNFSGVKNLAKFQFFKTYYKDYGLNSQTSQSNDLLPFDALWEADDRSDRKLNIYSMKLAQEIHDSVLNFLNSSSAKQDVQ